MSQAGFKLHSGKTMQNFCIAVSDLFGTVTADSADQTLVEIGEEGREIVNGYVDSSAEVDIDAFVKFLLSQWSNQRVRTTVKTFVLEIMTADLIEEVEDITDSNNREVTAPEESDELIDAIISMYEERLCRHELAKEMQRLRKEFEVEDPERLKQELFRLLPADANAFINFVGASFIEESETRTRELRHWSFQLPEASTAPKAPAAERNKIKALITKTADKLIKKIVETRNPSTPDSIAAIQQFVLQTVQEDVPVKPIFSTLPAALELFEKAADSLTKGNPDFRRTDVVWLLVRTCGSRLFESGRVRDGKLERGIAELGRILREKTPYRKLHDYIWNPLNFVFNDQIQGYTMVDTTVNMVRELRASRPSSDEIEDLIDDCMRIKNPHIQRLMKGIVSQWAKVVRNYAIEWAIRAKVISSVEPAGYVPPKHPKLASSFDDYADHFHNADLSSPTSSPSVVHPPALPISSSKPLNEPTPPPPPAAQPKPKPKVIAKVAQAPAIVVDTPLPLDLSPTKTPIPDVGSGTDYTRSWAPWCGRPLSLFELQNLKKYVLTDDVDLQMIKSSFASLGCYAGFADDVIAIVGSGKRTSKHAQVKEDAQKRLVNLPTSLFYNTVSPVTLPVRPSGLMMERGSLAELNSVLLTTFARHFLGIQVIDSQIVEDIIEYFGLHVLQEIWSLRFVFIAAATAWRKTSTSLDEAAMRAVSTLFVSFIPRPKHPLNFGSADLFFNSVETAFDIPYILTECFDVNTHKAAFFSDICGLLHRYAESVPEMRDVAKLLASDHGLLVTDEDSFVAFLEITVLNCGTAANDFELIRQALFDGLLSSQ